MLIPENLLLPNSTAKFEIYANNSLLYTENDEPDTLKHYIFDPYQEVEMLLWTGLSPSEVYPLPEPLFHIITLQGYEVCFD